LSDCDHDGPDYDDGDDSQQLQNTPGSQLELFPDSSISFAIFFVISVIMD